MLNPVQNIFLSALKQSVRPERKEELKIEVPEQIHQVMKLAEMQHLLPMIYDVIAKLPLSAECEKARNSYRRQAVLSVMEQAQRTKMFFEIYNVFLEKGIKPIIIKGIILRSMYENPDFRCSNDEDLLIEKKDFWKCNNILLEKGFVCEVEISDMEIPYEVAYFNKNTKVRIEIHTKLLPDNNHAFKGLNKIFERVTDNARKINVDTHRVWTLSDTDHFLFLLSHCYKHFIYCGFGIRQLCDLMIMAEKCIKTIDWYYIERVARENRLYIFFVNLLDIGEKKLGFDCCKLPLNQKVTIKPDSGNLLEDMLDAGVFGKSSIGRMHSANITMSAADKSFEQSDDGNRAAGENYISRRKVRLSIGSSLFPPKSYMEQNYSYLKNKGYLLPIAYVQRIRHYRKEQKVRSGHSIKISSVTAGKKRMELMRQYGII